MAPGWFERWAEGTERRQRWLLVLLCLAFYAPGLLVLPPTDREESRFAQSSKQMLESGNFVDVRLQEQPRSDRPVGAHWLQSVTAGLTGPHNSGNIWPYRLPSVLAALFAVQLVLSIGRALFDARVGIFGAVLFASSLLVGVEARVATSDAAMLAAVLVAQLALARIVIERTEERPRSWGAPMAFWAALAAGVLIKGPVPLLISVGTVLALLAVERDARWLLRLRPAAGLVLFALLVAPWVVAAERASSGAFLAQALGQDFVAQLRSGQGSHLAPPGAHFAAFWVVFWPSSLIAALAAPWCWAHRRESAVRFLLCWVVPAWVVFELVPNKLPHYLLPLYPAVAVLAAAAALGQPGPRRGLRSAVLALWAFVGLALAVGVATLPWDLGRRAGGAAILTAIVVVGCVVSVILRRHRSLQENLPWIVAASLLLQAGALQWVLPRLDALWPSRAAARAVRANRRCTTPVVASAGFSEPSLVFLLGTDTRLVSAEGAARQLLNDPNCGLALVAADQREAFLRTLADAGTAAVERAQIGGINYSKGTRVDLSLYSLPPAPLRP